MADGKRAVDSDRGVFTFLDQAGAPLIPSTQNSLQYRPLTAIPTPSDKANKSSVWTCLITNNDYLPGLLTLHYSLLKVKSQYPFVALYTSTFPESGLAALRARSIPHQEIKYLIPTKGNDYSNDPRFYDCWSKLTPFSLTQYKRIVQLDADMLVLQNMDELMSLEFDNPEVAARATPIPVPVDASLDETKAAPKVRAP